MTPPDVTLNKKQNTCAAEKLGEYAGIHRSYPAYTGEMHAKQTLHCLGIQIYVVKE